MIDPIRAHMPGAVVRVPQGGYFLWVELPPDVDADELVRRAAQDGVAIFSGRLSFAEQAPGQFLRLAYSFSIPSRINEGVQRIGRAYAAMRAEAARKVA